MMALFHRALVGVTLVTLQLEVISTLCPAPYSRYHANHTFCSHPNPHCEMIAQGVSSGEAEEIVRVHNELRSRVAMGDEHVVDLPQASDMLQMEWDEELATTAQKHAELCVFEHDCNQCRQTKNFNVGQNLYKSVSTSLSIPTPDWELAIRSWYSEVKDFQPELVNKYDPTLAIAPIGHFTQEIWSETWRVGCGYVSYYEKGNTVQLHTCNYGPAGNMYLGAVYKAGEYCSNCPHNTCCGESCEEPPYFPGLCRVLDGGPRYPKAPQDYDYFCDFSDEQSCEIVQPPDEKQWTISNTLSGDYIGIVLAKGESSSFEIANVFRASSEICFSLLYRKGPNLAGHETGNKAEGRVSIVGDNVITMKLERDSVKFMQYQMDLGLTGKMKFKFSVYFESTNGDQYLEISEISIKRSAC